MTWNNLLPEKDNSIDFYVQYLQSKKKDDKRF